MQEKEYQLTEKGKKILEDLNQYKEIGINMQEFAANLLGFKKDDE